MDKQIEKKMDSPSCVETTARIGNGDMFILIYCSCHCSCGLLFLPLEKKRNSRTTSTRKISIESTGDSPSLDSIMEFFLRLLCHCAPITTVTMSIDATAPHR